MLTCDKLFQLTNEVELIRHLVPNFDPAKKQNYKSIFSDKDDHPSLSFYQDNGKWKFKSHNTSHQGDIIQLWADFHQLDCKTQFKEVLQLIYDTLLLANREPPLSSKKAVKKPKITFTTTPSPLFYAYWAQFGVHEALLTRYNVREVATLQFTSAAGKDLSFNYPKKGGLAIGYTIDNRVKVYLPKVEANFAETGCKAQQKAFGFKNQTKKDVFGLAQLPAERLPYVVFAAGEKDCLVANAHGFPAIALQSENQWPEDGFVESLQQRCDRLVVCYDNDDPGRNAAQKLAEKYGLHVMQLPDTYKDIAELFAGSDEETGKQCFADCLEAAVQVEKAPSVAPPPASDDPPKQTIYHKVEAFWAERYDFRFNTLSKQYELSPKGQDAYHIINTSELWRELNKNGLTLSPNNTREMILSDLFPPYDPVQHYFDALASITLDDTDYISQLAGYVHTTEPEAWALALKKWLVRAIRCALDENYVNREALILVGAQRTGKTSFCRFLCPPALQRYATENISPHDRKDALISLATNFLIGLDEIQQFSRHDVGTLKYWMTQQYINLRLPFGKTATQAHRIASFVGTTNAPFLHDETGSTRFICFPIQGVNYDYHNKTTGKQQVDINKVWAQAYRLYQEGFCAELTAAEVLQNEQRNGVFRVETPEEELLATYFSPAQADATGSVFMTATDLVAAMQQVVKLNLNPIPLLIL